MDAVNHASECATPAAVGASVPPLPTEMPVAMPIQPVHQWDPTERVWPARPQGRARWRRIVVLTCVLALTAVASYEMYRVLTVHSMTTLQLAFLVLFTLTFVWIALPCVCGLAGLLALWRGRSVSGLLLPPLHPLPTLTTRTALLMPIYNEEPSRIFAGLQAIYESLDALGALASFDFFILSDTTDPEVWLEEERGFSALRQRTAGDTRIFYRHRRKNTRRKAGNIADFCQRWGARYEYMVILDADSLMTGEALVRLAAAMESQLQVGLIQTLPLMINRNTLFARAQQFAARVYGPIIAAGVAYWHLGDSSYWGHNAIIRTRAFLAHAGLPDLPGPPPFGGPILSHDFVEAALLRRVGWRVYLVPEILGSYEESPPSLLDFADRDRRWCQGNLQHSRLVTARGFHWLSRLHLLLGIMSYLASPLWLLFMLLGLLLALQAHFLRPDYFPQAFALFPTWPVFDPERAVRLFVGTMSVLVAPKLCGYLLLCTQSALVRQCGGRLRAGVSVGGEILLSALLAPAMMVMQTTVVLSIVTGRAVGWHTQRRDDGRIPLRTIIRRHRAHTLFGAVLAGAAYMISPPFLLWMSPVILGLVLAIPLSAVTGQPVWGRAFRRWGLLVTPEETAPPAVLQRANALARVLAEQRPQSMDALARLASDADLRRLHVALLSPQPERRKGDYDVDLLVGLAKLQDAESLQEAAALLSSREKLAVLGTRAGVEWLCQLRP
jgi:membrane glycosyltransferase